MIANNDLNNILHLDHTPNELEDLMKVKPGVDMERLVGRPHLFGRFKHIRCSQDSDEVINGVEYAFSTHNAWEWSTLYEAPLRWKFDYGMLMHDTNVILPGFRRSVESINGYLPWDHLPASQWHAAYLAYIHTAFCCAAMNGLKASITSARRKE